MDDSKCSIPSSIKRRSSLRRSNSAGLLISCPLFNRFNLQNTIIERKPEIMLLGTKAPGKLIANRYPMIFPIDPFCSKHYSIEADFYGIDVSNQSHHFWIMTLIPNDVAVFPSAFCYLDSHAVIIQQKALFQAFLGAAGDPPPGGCMGRRRANIARKAFAAPSTLQALKQVAMGVTLGKTRCNTQWATCCISILRGASKLPW